jgi:predicted RNA-binding protein with PUA-like domain
MARWLFKTEPSEYSFERLVKEKKTTWNGVTNALALIHIRNVKKGDPVLIYHTGDVKAIVGLAKAASDGYPDPKSPKLAVVDLVPERPLQPVTLAEIKSRPKFQSFDLVKNSRLSVMPVPDELWGELVR